ncbi:MAG: hypothetical protein H0W74_03845 [Sphingosinicella sp.]|nr:hypothetical protein [Sphingosinicella sp.]
MRFTKQFSKMGFAEARLLGQLRQIALRLRPAHNLFRRLPDGRPVGAGAGDGCGQAGRYLADGGQSALKVQGRRFRPARARLPVPAPLLA